MQEESVVTPTYKVTHFVTSVSLYQQPGEALYDPMSASTWVESVTLVDRDLDYDPSQHIMAHVR